ncbi:MAG: TM0106 family RecB-like putative nuclease [Thermodesulfobacteriota bacterium]
MSISASMLYDYVLCPHKIAMDRFGEPAAKDPVSAFVQLLWDKGVIYEKEVIESLQVPFENLRTCPEGDRVDRTLALMQQKVPLIYGGRIRADDLLGEPDLIKLKNGGYVAGDIKSGAGLEGGREEVVGRPKKHYAVQLGLYTDILERMGFSAGRTPFIWDINAEEVVYELNAPQGLGSRQSLWDLYEYTLESVRYVTEGPGRTLPCYAGQCKLCIWKSACLKQVKDSDDLTLIPELGRSRRDLMYTSIKSVSELAGADLNLYIKGAASIFPRISPEMLRIFQERARLLRDKAAVPYLRQPLELPVSQTELYFDIETDPFRDICYLHGFVERRRGKPKTERYVSFFMQTPSREEEMLAFRNAWEYISSRRPCALYYYSPYERTAWRKLQIKYPEVAGPAELEALFSDSATVDLYYDVVKHSEWPVNDYSIKTLAKFCGFSWRDSDPSGAASIEWYHRWVESGDGRIRDRILAYNEDDCIAMRVLLDRIKKLKHESPYS